MLTTKKTKLEEKKLFQIIFNSLNIKDSKIVRIKQTHSNNIKYVTDSGIYKNCDGIISNARFNLIPIIATADCIPLFIYDSNFGYYGLIHCGWRGIVSEIHIKALKDMINRGCDTDNLNIYIGPSIKGCCYEIGEDIVDNFSSKAINKINDKIYVDLSKEIKTKFLNIGVKSNNISESNICTYESKECYSYRKERGLNGRMYSMMIKV